MKAGAMRIWWALVVSSGISLPSASLAQDGQPGPALGRAGIARELGVPFPTFPSDNPPREAVVTLGRKLFFDKRLSRKNTVSCATCHDPNYGFADRHSVSVGSEGRSGSRNSPSVLNSAFVEPLMWDGKPKTLEGQSFLPFESREELDLPVNEAVAKLKRQGYAEEFKAVFGREINRDDLSKALANYQRSLLAGNSPFDRFLFLKDEKAVPEAAKRGFETFLRVKCDECHLVMTPGLHPFGLKMALFTDNKFHNLGVGTDGTQPDPGRYAVTGVPSDWGAFKTPNLRNVALTAPYFHDGSATTLMQVIEHYERGGKANKYLDRAIRPLVLTPEEKQDLVAFLESLTSSSIERYAQEEARSDGRPLERQ
jgi:cytochrome c peroxidase